MFRIFARLFISVLICACGFSHAQEYSENMLNTLVERGILTEQEAVEAKKLSAENIIVQHPKEAQQVTLLSFWHVRYNHIFQDYSHLPSYDMGGLAFRRIVPVVIAKFSESTRIMTTWCIPYNPLLNTMRFEHDIDTNYLRGTLWFAQDAVFFCMEEPQSGMRLMTPDRSIINMYFGGGDDEYWGGETKSFRSNVAFSGYHTGLYWLGKFLETDELVYKIEVVNSNHDKTSFRANNGIACFASIGYDNKTEKEHLKYGINAGYSSKVVAATDTHVLPSRTCDYGDCFGVNPYFWWNRESLTFHTEFVATRVKYGRTKSDNIALYTTNSQNAIPWGFYTLLAYKFNINPYGEIEPLFRYTYLDSDRRGISEKGVLFGTDSIGGLYNKVQSFYTGVNWYVQGNTIKYQLGLEYAKFKDAPSGLDSRKSNVLVFTLQIQLVL